MSVWDAAAALADRGVAPLRLQAKEGIALLAGSPVATALALARLRDAEQLAGQLLASAAGRSRPGCSRRRCRSGSRPRCWPSCGGSCELLAARQAWWLRRRPPAPGLGSLAACLEELVAPVVRDRPLGPDLDRLVGVLERNELPVP